MLYLNKRLVNDNNNNNNNDNILLCAAIEYYIYANASYVDP